MTMPTAHFKRQIEDYLLAALAAVPELYRVKMFTRGVLPDIAIPQELYPMCECYILRETSVLELTGNYYHQTYEGALVFSVLLTSGADADLFQRRGGRIAHVTSYDMIDELVWATLLELQRCANHDLAGLSTTDETVLRFSAGEEISYGLLEADRANNWAMTATMRFMVETEREV